MAIQKDYYSLVYLVVYTWRQIQTIEKVTSRAFLLIEMNAWKARHFQNAVFSTHNPGAFNFIGALVIKPVGINFG